jgi:hypothetical protein
MLKGSKYENIKFFGCVIVHLLMNGTYKEYRVENSFINTIMEMEPLPRINEVMEHKNTQELREVDRITKVKALLNG